MPEYRVKWEIDVEAETPQDAAREALQIQRDTESVATVFEVYRTDWRVGMPSENSYSTVDLQDIGAAE